MAYDIMSGFKVGQAMAGSNALGIFAKGLLDRVNKVIDAQSEARAKSSTDILTQQSLLKSLGGGLAGSRISGGGVVTGANIAGLNVEFPGAKAAVTQAEEEAKQMGQIAPIAQSMRNNLLRLRGLASTITAPQAGFPSKFLGVAGLRLGAAIGKFPQVSEYQNVIRLSLIHI